MTHISQTVGSIDPIRSKFIAQQVKLGIKIVRLSVCSDGVEIVDAREQINILLDPITLGGIVRAFGSTHFVITQEKYNELIRKYNLK